MVVAAVPSQTTRKRKGGTSISQLSTLTTLAVSVRLPVCLCVNTNANQSQSERKKRGKEKDQTPAKVVCVFMEIIYQM